MKQLSMHAKLAAPGVDETYLKVRGRWVYLYRAVDKEGNTVDFRLSPKRDVAAAKAFFRKALRTQGRAPLRITLDGYVASHRAVHEIPSENEVWRSPPSCDRRNTRTI